MKDSIKYKIAVLIAVPVIYFFTVSGFKTETNSAPSSIVYSKDFTNCIFNPEYGYVHGIYELYPWENLDKFEELHYNAINWYDFIGDGGTDTFGMPGTPLEPYHINNFKWVMNKIASADPPIKGFYEKCNFSVPMYGQRLVYEIYNGVPDNPQDINYGFTYQNVMENVYTTDEGRTVLHPRPGINQAGYLCKDIYENFQHTDLFDFRQNDKGTWYLKPVLKIPVNTDPDAIVAKIDIISFDNQPVKQIVLRGMNFNVGGSYGGQYTDKYVFGGLNDSLQILGDDEEGHLNQGRRAHEDLNSWSEYCHVDFRVHWEGQVEVWFDKMVVDDEIARDVFDLHRYDDMITQQAEKFTNYGSYYTFFTDEICISQVPCIKYVLKTMREAPNLPPGDPPKFSIAVTNYLHVRGLKNDNLSYKYFFDSLEVEHVLTPLLVLSPTTKTSFNLTFSLFN